MQKLLTFCSKKINVYENTIATKVNEFVINQPVKLTMLWRTGSWVWLGCLLLGWTRQSAQWGTYTPEERYRQFLTSTKYVALTLEMAGWMNSMLIAISPKPLCRRIIKFNKRSWWYSYINLDAIFFYFYMKFLSLWPWPEGHTLYLPTCQI